MIDYYLSADAKETSLDIYDATNKLVRHYSSRDTMYAIPPVNIPLYWVRPQDILSAAHGAHRFLWDMHYTPLNVPPSYPISAIYENTAPAATSPWVMPGNYTVKLTVDGKVYTQPLTLKMDPRVKTPKAALQQQHDIAYQYYTNTIAATNTERIAQAAATQLKAIGGHDSLVQHINDIIAGLHQAIRRSHTVYDNVEGADVPPTTQAITAGEYANALFLEMDKKWTSAKKEIAAVNQQLQSAGRPTIKLE
jgi:hypothetical protein